MFLRGFLSTPPFGSCSEEKEPDNTEKIAAFIWTTLPKENWGHAILLIVLSIDQTTTFSIQVNNQHDM